MDCIHSSPFIYNDNWLLVPINERVMQLRHQCNKCKCQQTHTFICIAQIEIPVLELKKKKTLLWQCTLLPRQPRQDQHRSTYQTICITSHHPLKVASEGLQLTQHSTAVGNNQLNHSPITSAVASNIMSPKERVQFENYTVPNFVYDMIWYELNKAKKQSKPPLGCAGQRKGRQSCCVRLIWVKDHASYITQLNLNKETGTANS